MPRLRLTVANVESLPAANGARTDYFDTQVPELVLRVYPSGRRVFAVKTTAGRGRAGRRTVRVTLGRPSKRLTLEAAKEQAREIVANGGPLDDDTIIGGAPAALRVAELVRQALAHLELAPSTRHEWERLERRDLAELGLQAAADLDRGAVRAWQRAIGARTQVTANRCLTVLRRCYTWAIDEELLERSPLLELRGRLFTEHESDRVLSPDELRRLLGALARLRECWPAYTDATLLLLLTCTRESAVLGMRRDELHDLDGETPTWIVPPERAKRRRRGRRALEPHHVPLSPAAVAVVRRRLEAVDELLGPNVAHLFPVGGRQAGTDRPMTWSSNFIAELREEMRAVRCDDAGRPLEAAPLDPRWTVHNLRHTCATSCVELGFASLPAASLMLGHGIAAAPTRQHSELAPRVTAIYVRAPMLPERRAALERWAAWLERLADDQAPGGRVLAFRASL